MDVRGVEVTDGGGGMRHKAWPPGGKEKYTFSKENTRGTKAKGEVWRDSVGAKHFPLLLQQQRSGCSGLCMPVGAKMLTFWETHVKGQRKPHDILTPSLCLPVSVCDRRTVPH